MWSRVRPLRGGEAPAYAINLNTGAGLAHHVSFDPAVDPPHWFVLDVAIAREHGRVLWGALPRDVFPAIARDRVRAALVEALAWYRSSGGVADAETVLAACRALRWQRDGTWTSKGEAARWALSLGDDEGVVAGMLRVGEVDVDAARRFVDAAVAELRR